MVMFAGREVCTRTLPTERERAREEKVEEDTEEGIKASGIRGGECVLLLLVCTTTGPKGGLERGGDERDAGESRLKEEAGTVYSEEEERGSL